MDTEEICANCEELILGQPVFFDGSAYCCTGCIAGGPCICTYTSPVEAPPPAVSVAQVPQPAYSAPIMAGPVYRAAAPVEDTRERGREPIPFPSRDGGQRAIVLRLGGFRDQRDLLEFSLALEDVNALAEVSLTRAEPADAWFAVRAAFTQQVVAALQEVRGWLISASASDAYVEGRVESVPVEVARTETEPLLPHRTRFRVFGSPRVSALVGGPITSGLPVAESALVAPEEPAVELPAAYQPVEATPAAPPVYTAPPVPVLPVPARPVAVPVPQRFVQPPQPVLPAASTRRAMPPVVPVTSPYVAEPAPMAPAPAAPPAALAPVAPAPASAPVAAPAPRPAAAPMVARQSDMIAVDDRPGGAVPLLEHLTLVVYPFHSFVALNEFQGAVRVLRGVPNTRVRRFYRGTLHLAVDYDVIIPLAERLQDLRGFRWQMVSENLQEIEILLEDTGALMAAEGDG